MDSAFGVTQMPRSLFVLQPMHLAIQWPTNPLCHDEKTSTFLIDSLHKPEFKVFPNPVEEQLIISTINDEMIGLFIYDASGRQVYEQTKLSSTLEEISFSDFSSGLYTIKLITKAYGVQLRKVIKP